MPIESNVITVEDTDGEPTLSINQEELNKALDNSNNPEGLKAQTEDIIASINNQADDYLALGLFEDGEYSAEEVDAANAMKKIADKINANFDGFHNIENISTDSLIASLSTLNGKTITNILDLYRKPALHEGLQQRLQKVSSRKKSMSEGLFGHIGSKRVK